MTNQSHTKRTTGPWTHGLLTIHGGAASGLIATVTATANPAIGEADAAFIVRACNSHDALVAALREISDKSRIDPDYRSANTLTLKLASIGSMARAALAAATGDSNA